MLDMQMEYHCYNSARLEAAVEARMQGVSVDEIARRKFPPLLRIIRAAESAE